MQSMRMSMNSINNFGSGAQLNPVHAQQKSIAQVSHSSVYSGGIIQPHHGGSSIISDSAGSSYYYNPSSINNQPQINFHHSPQHHNINNN